MYCFSTSFCYLCLTHLPKSDLLDINKNYIKKTKLIDVLHFCGFDSNFCDDSYQVYVCEKCINRIKPFYAFKLKCSNNFTTLKGYVTKMKPNTNTAFHANLKVILTDPKHSDSEPTIEYMDVSQFVETQIQADETDETDEAPKELDKPPEIVNVIPQENINNPLNNIEQLYEISKFIYDNHFMNVQEDYNEVIEIASSPDSIPDIPQNSSGSFNDEQLNKTSRNFCRICNKTFSNPNQLSIHEFLHTLITYPNNEASKSMRYYCALCFLDFIGLSQIKTHLVSHTFDKLFTCKSCKEDFLVYNDYFKHLVQNPLHKPFVCNICFRRFTTMKKLNSHSKKEHVFSCMFCKSFFDSKLELKAHMVNKHNNAYCYICSESFESNEHLKKHLFDNHFELQAVGLNGKLQYNCPKCRVEFLTKYSLNEHLSGCGSATTK